MCQSVLSPRSMVRIFRRYSACSERVRGTMQSASSTDTVRVSSIRARSGEAKSRLSASGNAVSTSRRRMA